MNQVHWNAEFPTGELTLRGVLRKPESGGPHPLVVMAHGMGGLKEWANIPSVSAALLEAGIATLAFDYRNFGDSEGEPRDEVDYSGQIEDFQSAISFASTLENVDGDRIGIWGTSLGGRNVLLVAARDNRVKCVVSQVPGLQMPAEALAYMGGYGGDAAALEQALAEDKRNRTERKEARYIPMVGDDLESEETPAHIRTFGEAEKRNWNRRFSFQSLNPAGFSDLASVIPDIKAPVLFVLTDHDFCAPMSKSSEFYDMLPEPKAMMVMPGQHYDFYTRGKSLSAEAARDWFVRHLKR